MVLSGQQCGFVWLPAASLLFLLLAVQAQNKLAERFQPMEQAVHVGVSITVFGARLTTADRVVLCSAESCSQSSSTCGTYSNPPAPLLGTKESYFKQVASDGRYGVATLTPKEVASSWVCVNLFPSRTWVKVTNEAFNVTNPSMTVVQARPTTPSLTLLNYEPLFLKLRGQGLVQGLDRLAFKLFNERCDSITEPQSETIALTWANGASSEAELTLVLQTSIASSNLVLCFSSNGGLFHHLLDGIRLNARAVTTFSPTTTVPPSIPTTFTLLGIRLDETVEAELQIQAATHCSGQEDGSDIPGGHARTATIVSQSQAEVTFELGPVLTSISGITVDVKGAGYLSGLLRVSGGGGHGFAGRFTADPSGGIDHTYVSSFGGGFSSDPLVEAFFQAGTRCGSEARSDACKMEGAVTRLVKGTGQTKGCFVGMNISAGGDGVGFRAVVSASDVFGQISSITIVNYGAGYSSAPQLLTADSRCQCGTDFVDGQPLAASYQVTTTLGNMDPCFTSRVASGAALSAFGGWQDRNVILCSRFGGSSWQRVGSASALLDTVTSSSVSPAVVPSGQPFIVTVIGTGFASGARESRIKLAEDCARSPASDRVGAVTGGEGRACESVDVVGSSQECKASFTLLSTIAELPLQVCRRIAGADYTAIAGSSFSLTGVQVTGMHPSHAHSTGSYVVTVSGINIDGEAAARIKAKVCADYICVGGGVESNEGEPCQGLSDSRTCLSGASCVSSTGCFGQNRSDSSGIIFGGEGSVASSFGDCAADGYDCGSLVFKFTLLSMIDVTGGLWISSEDGVYAPLRDGNVSVEGSELTSLAVPSTINSAESFTITVAGRNLVATGPGAVMFKYSNATCDAGGTRDDASWSILGGVGRNVSDLVGIRTALTGTVTFQLVSSRAVSASSLCWRIGGFQYRDVQVVNSNSQVIVDGQITSLTRSTVSEITPSDYSSTLGDISLPVFRSREVVSLTVLGTNFGVNGNSPLTVRPIAMPFATDTTAQQCVFADTIIGAQPETCKEFRYDIDLEDGGASSYCSAGSSLDSIRIRDYQPVEVGDWTGGQQYAVFELQTTVIIDAARFMLCWRMSEDDDVLFPWQVVGHVEARSENQGNLGLVFWSVFVSHTFGLQGAYVSSIAHANIVANAPFTLTVEGVGFGCDEDDPELLLKVAVANTVQAMVGADIGGGCSYGASSDSLGAVEGGTGMVPVCVSGESDAVTVLEIRLAVGVEFVTPLELCWSTTTGSRSYQNAFYEGRSALVTFDAAPPMVEKILINNLPMGAAPLMAHVQFSVSLFGTGMMKDGPVPIQLMIAEDCADSSSVVPGGEEREPDCSFGTRNLTIEFTLLHRSERARLCIRRAAQREIMLPYLEGTRSQCSPTYCGAPLCQTGSNYLFDGFSCDTTCCLEKCESDPDCRYWQYFEVVGRVFRKCQTSAHCFDRTIPNDEDTTPFITQKTVGLFHLWEQLGASLVVTPPRVTSATAQREPRPSPSVPFALVVQGLAFESTREQVHVKLVNQELFNGACNDESLLNETLDAWQTVVDKRESVEKFVLSLTNFSFNGTCAGGERNCVGGPAPPLTVCVVDNDCVPALGGLCGDPNTGESCLQDAQCNHGGFCNNSLYNLSLTPTPQPPPLQIPFIDLARSGVLPGGEGRFLQVQSTQLGYATFTSETIADAVICVAIRDPEAELLYQTEGFITDRQYIVAMASYVPFGIVRIENPQISEVFPDHVFPHVPTTVTFGGIGLSLAVRVKIVYSLQGCGGTGLTGLDADMFGAVPGGEGRALDWVNSLGTNASVKMTITASMDSSLSDQNLYFVCYTFTGSLQYQRAGRVWLEQRPPIVIGFAPNVMFANEPTQIILKGSGLGAGQKVKLVNPEQGCRGTNLLSAVHDEWAVARGSHASVVEQSAGKPWADIEGDPLSNETMYSRVSATLTVQGDASSVVDEEYHLCLKYSDEAIGTVEAGYHKVGTISLRHPQVTAVVTRHLKARGIQQISLEGAGLQSQDELQLRIIQSFCGCETATTDDSCATAGGWGIRLLPDGRTSTSIRAEITIPDGVSTTGTVCSRFVGHQWTPVGEVSIGPPLADVSIRNGAGIPIDEIVEGEPLIVQVSMDAEPRPKDRVKLISAGEDCQGTDGLGGVLQGGNGVTINTSKIALFKQGVAAIPGVSSTGVRACILLDGGSAFQSSSGQQVWPLLKPVATEIEPRRLAARTETKMSVKGKGLATPTRSSWIVFARGAVCQDGSLSWQLRSEDGGVGLQAHASVTLLQPGQYAACLRVSDQTELSHIGSILVDGFARLDGVLPTTWLVGNETSMLLFGSGFGDIRVKWVPAGGACTDEAFPGGSERGIVAKSAAGDEATTESFTLTTAGTAKLCTTDSFGGGYSDTGISVTVQHWVEPLLLYPEIGRRSDTQRVEAAMTRVLPACAATWQSDWTLTGPGEYVSRDTPAIVDWNDPFKCWEANEAVPETYPQGVGYRPSGEDMRLIEATRNVPLRIVIAGGVGVGDTVFVSQSSCGSDLTKPMASPSADAIPGGDAVVITSDLLIDVTSNMCGGSQAVSQAVTGVSARIMGAEVYFALSEVSKPGEYHRICLVPKGFAQSFDVAAIDLKVGPPVLIGVEPPVVFAGMRVKFTLLGSGLLAGDEVKVVDGERYRGCIGNDNSSFLPGGTSIVLGESETSLFNSSIELQLTAPSRHARMCYRYLGSESWEEMTSRTQLRTSGYLYGYEGNMHFFFGEIPTPQSAENRVFGDNQTIMVLAPRANGIREQETVAREPLTMTVDGIGLTEDGRYIVVPERVGCGGTANTRPNLVEDGSGTIEPHLVTVDGGQARAPTALQNDAAENAKLLSRCVGTDLLDGCSYSASSTDIVEVPAGFGVSAIGLVRVCYRYHRASEYSEVGVINVIPPYLVGMDPISNVLLYKPFVLSLKGRSLGPTDLIKVVRGISCNAPISSRPYLLPLNVTDSPLNSRGEVLVTLTGPGQDSPAVHKVCYSFNDGVSFVDTGFSISVVSPNISRVFPTVLALSGERRIHLYGNAVSQGDRVKIIHAAHTCQGTDDIEGAVYGGGGRLLDVDVQLAANPGIEQWPSPATSGSAVFLLPRTDAAKMCYLHREGASWQPVLDSEGKPVQIQVVSTVEEALALQRSQAASHLRVHRGGAGPVTPFLAATLILVSMFKHR